MHICANDPRSRKAITTDLSMSYIGVGKVGRTMQIDASILKVVVGQMHPSIAKYRL